MVTQKKFEAEFLKFRAIEKKYKEKGIICSKVLFPDIHFVFAIPKLNKQKHSI